MAVVVVVVVAIWSCPAFDLIQRTYIRKKEKENWSLSVYRLPYPNS
jgi:hypothetical protein